MNFSEAGRLFTFSDYVNGIDPTPYYVYMTHSAPAIVYEIAINSHFNANFVRSFVVYDEYVSRLVGSDVLSVNQIYIAHLIFDLERMIEIVRIYYRDASNFAYGHTDILLKKFVTRVSVVSFLDFSDNPYIFVQNACIGTLFKINDLKFEIDTSEMNENYSKYANKTYRADILVYNDEKQTEKAIMRFNITFAEANDMTTYFIGDLNSYYFGYSYGDSSFSKPISTFYLGPDLKFNLTLKSDSDYVKSLILPNITSTQEKSNIREFHTSEECNQSFFNRYANYEIGTENIAFYCIQNSTIEEHIFRTKDLIETRKVIYPYSRYSFVDFYVNLYDSDIANEFTDLLVVLGIQRTGKIEQYYLHYFDLKNDVITWFRKVLIDTQNIQLRDYNPLIDFNKGEYLVFIDRKETTLMLISAEGEFKHSFKTKDRCKDLDIHNDLLMVTYYMKNIVSVYKLSKYISDDGTFYLTTEFLNDFTFKTPLFEFNTKGSNMALTFSGDNTIKLYEISSAYSINFVRQIPLFKYKRNMKFLINKDTDDVTYARYEEFLYVVLYNTENEKDKKLFCFNLKDTNHDTLYSVIDLDPFYYKTENKIFIENGKFVSTKYIYLFYGGKQYQYIKFEPENRIQITNPEYKELCVPKDKLNMNRYDPINITMILNPIYNDYIPLQNSSTEIVLMCMNYGLKIESRVESNSISYKNKEGEATVSLMDYFDGFNCNFTVSSDEIDHSYYNLDQDESFSYLLESANSTQKAIFTVEYENYILIFFNQTGKLQVYDIKDTSGNISKIDKDYDYNVLFKNCSIDFIEYSYIESTGDSFFTLSCKSYTGKISQAYMYKVFHIDDISDKSINLTLMFQTSYSYKIVDAELSRYKIDMMDQYTLVMISDRETQVETYLIFITFTCTGDFECRILNLRKMNGNDYKFDSFIVNSFIFYGTTQYILISINNFGLGVIDCSNLQIRQLIPIYDSYFHTPPKKMDIYTIIPLGDYGVRVLLQDEGGFSLYWYDIVEEDNEMFQNFEVLDRFENINREVPTHLYIVFKYGYAQVIKYPNLDDKFDNYLRIYSLFNRDKSKNYKEFLIDKIDECETIDYITYFSDIEVGIVLVCGYQLFVYYIVIAPELTLNRQVTLNITASNYFSNQTITINADKNEIACEYERDSISGNIRCVEPSKSFVAFIFILILIFFFVLFLLILRKIMNSKPKSINSSNDKDIKLTNGLSKKGTRHSEEVKIDGLAYERNLKKASSFLETLEEDLNEDDLNEESENKIESNIRSSINYKIQQSVDSFISNEGTERNSEFSSMIRQSYNRSSTRSYYESLNK